MNNLLQTMVVLLKCCSVKPISGCVRIAQALKHWLFTDIVQPIHEIESDPSVLVSVRTVTMPDVNLLNVPLSRTRDLRVKWITRLNYGMKNELESVVLIIKCWVFTVLSKFASL